MSKASEWAKLQVPQLNVANLVITVSHEYDKATRENAARPICFIQKEPYANGMPLYIALAPQDALTLARWILDMFGES